MGTVQEFEFDDEQMMANHDDDDDDDDDHHHHQLLTRLFPILLSLFFQRHRLRVGRFHVRCSRGADRLAEQVEDLKSKAAKRNEPAAGRNGWNRNGTGRSFM